MAPGGPPLDDEGRLRWEDAEDVQGGMRFIFERLGGVLPDVSIPSDEESEDEDLDGVGIPGGLVLLGVPVFIPLFPDEEEEETEDEETDEEEDEDADAWGGELEDSEDSRDWFTSEDFEDFEDDLKDDLEDLLVQLDEDPEDAGGWGGELEDSEDSGDWSTSEDFEDFEDFEDDIKDDLEDLLVQLFPPMDCCFEWHRQDPPIPVHAPPPLEDLPSGSAPSTSGLSVSTKRTREEDDTDQVGMKRQRWTSEEDSDSD